MDRRKFLLLTLAASGSMSIGRGFLAPAFAAPAQPGDSPYGPLLDPDANGVRLPEGFTSRIIKQGLQPIGSTSELARPFPDGAATFPTDDGGWILVSNSETPPPADIVDPTGIGIDGLGGVQAIVFSPDGDIVDAYSILGGAVSALFSGLDLEAILAGLTALTSRSNCAGGATPWGTWLSCEEVDDGQNAANSGLVFECDPTGVDDPVQLPLLGRFKHENASVDPVGKAVYLSEDLGDGCFYRFLPASYPDGGRADLTAGVLEAAVVADDDSVTWVEVPDPACAGGVPCRNQAAGATRFDGGEGCVYDDGKVFLTTKGDDRVWMYDTIAETMVVLYDAGEFTEPVLTGVDHIIAQAGTGNLVVAEDGGNLEAVMIARDDFSVFPILQLTGPEHDPVGAFPEPVGSLVGEIPVPIASEITGLAFNPAGDRLYFNSQRGSLLGITYEVSGPWLETLVPAQPAPTTTPTTAAPAGAPDPSPSTPVPTESPSGARLPETGPGLAAGGALGAGAAVAAAAGAVQMLRRRLDARLPDREDADGTDS